MHFTNSLTTIACAAIGFLAHLHPYCAHGQETNEPRRSYMRPSWVAMTATATDPLEQRVYDGFNHAQLSGKFNDHGTGPLTVHYDRLAAADTAKRAQVLQNGIIPATPAIVAKWFNRDTAGGMDTRIILERGTYSESDLDRIINLLSSVDRSGMQGWQLLDLTYLPVFEVTKVERTKRFVKNETDPKKQTDAEKTLNLINVAASAAQGKVPAPKKDTSFYEGWAVSWKVDLYKLDWTDSVEWQFAQHYWNDRTNPDPAKALAWADARFPVRKAAKTSLTRSAHVEREIIAGQAQPPLEELLNAFAPQMQEQAVKEFSKQVRDLRPRAGVASDYPISAKLGKKEGLSMNDRFVAYEYTLKKKKGMVLKRKGVLRVHKVAKNDNVTDGRGMTSTFQQQGGKRIERGMTVEEAHDTGTNLSVGWRVGDALSIGPQAMLKTNLIGSILGIPNLYLGGHGALTYGSNIDASGLPAVDHIEGHTSSDGQLIEPGKWGGAGNEYGLSLSLERYPFKRGNLYFEPTIAYTWASFNVRRNGDMRLANEVADIGLGKWNDDVRHAFSYKTNILSFAWGIAHHFGPVALELRPSVGFRGGFEYATDDGSSFLSTVDPTRKAASDGPFSTSVIFTVSGGLKLRF